MFVVYCVCIPHTVHHIEIRGCLNKIERRVTGPRVYLGLSEMIEGLEGYLNFLNNITFWESKSKLFDDLFIHVGKEAVTGGKTKKVEDSGSFHGRVSPVFSLRV